MNPVAIHPVTPERHQHRRWHPFDSFAWAASQVVVPLVGSELPRAASCLTLAFVERAGEFDPVALLGLESGVSLYVGAQGEWLGAYVPALLRGRPFMFAPTDDGRKVLCVDEVAGQVSEEHPQSQGEAFFADDGGLATKVKEVADFLSVVESSRMLTIKACASLREHGLFVPWSISLATESGRRDVQGLFRIDEEALNGLSDENFLALRRTGAVPIAYAQLLSLQHFDTLGALARARATSLRQSVVPVTSSGDLDLSFLERGDTLKFS